jgi:phage tail P2-like protein
MIYDPDNVSEEVLDMLAYEEHVDYYNRALSKAQKLVVVKSAIPIHRTRGTRGAVEHLVSDVFASATLKEWFEYAGSPYKFKISVDYSEAVATQINELRRLIDSVKNTRSHLEAIELTIRDYLVLSEQLYKSTMTWNYLVGTWVVGQLPIATTSQEVALTKGGGGIWQ